jgi:hypothetical protein
MLDPTLNVALALLIVQGLKAIGFPVSGELAKIISLAVTALFLFANGMIDAFLPPEYRPLAQQIVDFIKAILLLFAPAGAYSFVKFFTFR